MQSEGEDTGRVEYRPEYRQSLTYNALPSQNRPKPPFKLCFGSAQEIGRSELQPRLPGIPMVIIAPKFYSAFDTLTNEDESEVESIVEAMKKAKEVGPREKYEEPLLESHKYGWYQDKLIQLGQDADKFTFPRRTSDMVKTQSILHNAFKADKHFQQYQLSSRNKQV